MEVIKLSNTNEHFIIDSEMLQKISVMRWAKTYYGYVEGYSEGKKFLLHRFIMNLKHGDKRVVDHINGDKLDNRLCNLRICTHSENLKNAKKPKGSKLTLKGVHKYKNENLKKPYRAQIMSGNKRVHIGYFETELEAAKAYDEAAKRYHGEFARTNFKYQFCPRDEISKINV